MGAALSNYYYMLNQCVLLDPINLLHDRLPSGIRRAWLPDNWLAWIPPWNPPRAGFHIDIAEGSTADRRVCLSVRDDKTQNLVRPV